MNLLPGLNIYKVEKLVNILDSGIKHFVDTLKLVELKLIKLHPDNACTIKHVSKLSLMIVSLMKKRKSFIVVSLLKNNWMIWKDSVIPYNIHILTISLLKIVDLELTTKEKVFKPFWNGQCLDNSKKLWLPIKTACVDLGLNLSNSFVPETVQESLYLTKKSINPLNKNLQKTSCPLLQSLRVSKWVKENTKPILKMKKIKLYPSQIQRKILIEWFNTSRYVYNKVLNSIINEDEKINKFELRNKYVTWNKGTNNNVKEFETNTPKVIRQESINDLCKAYKTCFSQLKSRMINKFNINFKTKKNKIQSIGIERSAKLDKKNKTIKLFKNIMKENHVFKIGKRQSKDKELKDLEIKNDCRICYDGYNFYLCIPVEEQKIENGLKNEIIALDPGTRTFMTGYDPDGNIIEYNRRDNLLNKLKDKLSLLQSKRKKRIKIVRQKIKNCVDELHWQTINNLTMNYKKVLLPHFESQKMSMKSHNKILNRDFNILSHYKFKQRLYYKSIVNGTKIYDVGEEYTTKTCTNCGNINNVGSDKEICCNKCSIIIERDYNGARNILLKHLE